MSSSPTTETTSPVLANGDNINSKEKDSAQQDIEIVDDVDPAESVELAAETSAVGKVKALFGMLSRMIGVKDIVNMRISLPATLLDPVSNLEYWNYMDRPDLFLEIPDSEDPVDRMINVVKWLLSKDSKWTVNKVAKPYNSVLGEQFLCKWTVKQPSGGSETVYNITEQISHHPPVSAFYYYNQSKGIIARGVDHVCAKFTGTCVKVFPGPLNKGIFVTLEKRDNEEYLCTHPCAFVNGWLKASLYVTIGEQSIIFCPKTRLKAVVEYKEESFFGKAKFAIQGKILNYDPDTEPAIARKYPAVNLSKIPKTDVVCSINGCWKGAVYYQKTELANKTAQYPCTEEQGLLVDISQIPPLPKEVGPDETQGPCESRQIWRAVTAAITEGRFNEATTEKRKIEDEQRKKDRERKAKNETWTSHWFAFSKNLAALVASSPSPHRRMPSVSSSATAEEDLFYSVKGAADDPIEDADVGCGMEGKPLLRHARLNDLPWKG